LERFFRDLKRDHRRRTGSNSYKRALKSMPTNAPLVKNLQNPDYVAILVKGQPTLEARFADIDASVVREEMKKLRRQTEKIPKPIRKLLTLPDLSKRVTQVLVAAVAS